MDDSGVDSMQKLGGGMALRRQASDTNLTADYAAGGQPSVRGGKFSSISKAIGPNQQGMAGTKRAKSPFSLFKRPKSREPSPMGAADMQSDTLPVRITVRRTKQISHCCVVSRAKINVCDLPQAMAICGGSHENALRNVAMTITIAITCTDMISTSHLYRRQCYVLICEDVVKFN